MSTSLRRSWQCVATEIVHPAVMWPGALGVALAVLIGARAGTLYAGWYNSVTLASVTVMLLGPLCFGVSALRRQRWISSGFAAVARTTPRGETGVCLVSTVAVGTWGVLALTAGNAMSAIRATVDGAPDWRIGLLYLLGVVAIGTASAAGTALARFATTPITVALISVGSVMAIMGITYLGSGLRFVSPIDPSTAYFGWTQPNVDLTMRRVGLTVAVGLIATLLWVGGRAWRRIVIVAAAGAAVVVSLTLPDDMYADAVIRTDTGNRICSSGPLPVCVWPEHRDMLASATEAATRIAALVDGIVPVPDSLGEPGTLQRQREGFGILQLPTELPTVSSAARTKTPSPDMFLAVAAAVLPQAPPCAGDPAISARRSTMFDWVMLRVGAGQFGASAEAQRLVRLSQEQQRVAIRGLITATTTCP